jgi:hypothetical protein
MMMRTKSFNGLLAATVLGLVAVSAFAQTAPKDVLPQLPPKPAISGTLTAITPGTVSTPSATPVAVTPASVPAPQQVTPEQPKPTTLDSEPLQGTNLGQPPPVGVGRSAWDNVGKTNWFTLTQPATQPKTPASPWTPAPVKSPWEQKSALPDKETETKWK